MAYGISDGGAHIAAVARFNWDTGTPVDGRPYTLLAAASATGSSVAAIAGGSYIWGISGAWNAATAKLQALLPNGISWTDVATATADGAQGVIIGDNATLRVLISGGPPSAVYSNLTPAVAAGWPVAPGRLMLALQQLAPGIADLSSDLPNRWAVGSNVQLLSGLFTSSALSPVPAGDVLFSAAGAATVKLTNASAALNVVAVQGDGALVKGLTLNGNLAAREAAGFASYTHGAFSLNNDNVAFQDLTVTDYGETVAASALLNTCAVVIDSDATNPEATTGGVIRRCFANDVARKAPYGFRLRSQFIGYARGEIPGMSGAVIEDSTVFGTMKNAVELAGPNVHDCVVRRVSVSGHTGQGGIETDYGAYNNLFEDCDVGHPSTDDVITRSTAAFSFRASDQGDGKLKEGSGNISRRCRAHHHTSAPGFNFKGFHLISVRDSTLENFKVDSCVRGAAADPDALVGIYIQTDYGEVHDIAITNPDISSMDQGLTISGANPCSGVTVSGGSIQAQARGYNEPTSTLLSNILFTGGVVLTADRPVYCAPGRTTPVAMFDTVTLRGNSLQLNASPTAAQFKNTAFILPPLGKAALEASLPGITSSNGNSYDRMPPGEAYLLRHANVLYDAAKIAAYKACLDGLLADGLLDKIDVLSILAAPYQATALQNATQAAFNATLTGAPTFAAGQGFSGADASNYVQLAYQPGTSSGVRFSRDSACMALWKGAGASVLTRAGTSVSRLSTRSSLAIDWRPNMVTPVTATAAQDFAVAWWTRPDATKFSYGYDSTVVGTDVAGASEALTASNMLIGATGGTASTGNGLHKAFLAAEYLTPPQMQQAISRVNALLAALV